MISRLYRVAARRHDSLLLQIGKFGDAKATKRRGAKSLSEMLMDELRRRQDEREAAAPSEDPTLRHRVLRSQRVEPGHVGELVHVEGEAGCGLNALRHPQEGDVRECGLAMAASDVGVGPGKPDLCALFSSC